MPAEATASLTPSPTCAFEVMSGDCGATYPCITSPNYTENYALEGSCVIKLSSLTLDVKDFETEVLWDTMMVNGKNYSGSTGPVGVGADGRISCFSDGAGRQMSSSIYVVMPAQNPPPTHSSTSHIVVSDGDCDVVVIVSIVQVIHQIMENSGM